MDPVVHFEIPYEDQARIARFYESVFDWRTQALGTEMGSYVLVTTAGTTAAGQPRPGAIDGGFFPRTPERPGQFPSVVIAVEDIARSMDKVRRSGGTVLGEPVMIGGVGKYVAFVDTEGNRASMLEPLPRDAGAPAGP